MTKKPGNSSNKYLGLSESDAIHQIKADGYFPRVIGRDGESYAITMELNSKRVNLTINKGKVITASFDLDI